MQAINKQLTTKQSLVLMAVLFALLTGSALRLDACAQVSKLTIGEVHYFGYDGLDIDKVKTALSDQIGKEITPEKANVWLDQVKSAIRGAIGKEVNVDLNTVCCNPEGKFILYIGLSGRSTVKVPNNPAPTEKVNLPQNIVDLYQQITGEALIKAMQKGKVSEDDTKGYALFSDPTLRDLQTALHEKALGNEAIIRQVLSLSADPKQRQAAAMALGYGQQSQDQIDALVRACRDPDETVRNNATRALVVLSNSKSKWAEKIPGTEFIDMLNSPTWTDRNKGSGLLASLSEQRDPQLLIALRAHAFQSLREMAYWDHDHAKFARQILGRIGGIPEAQLEKMVASDQADQIVKAATEKQ